MPAAAQKGQPAAKPAATSAKPAATSAPLAALFAAYWDEQARLFPLAATAEGGNRYNDQFPNDQPQTFRSQLRAFYQHYQTRLRRTARQALNATGQTSYDFLDYDLATRLAGLQQPTRMGPITQSKSLTNTLGQYESGQGNQPFKTAPPVVGQ